MAGTTGSGDELRRAVELDEGLRAELAACGSQREWDEVMARHGLDVLPAAPAAEGQLSDAELEGVAGGYTFPVTDWVYCDNPWTNVWCTLKCS